MTEMVNKQESYAIVGASFEVYNDKGCGFLERSIKSVSRLNLSSKMSRLLQTTTYSQLSWSHVHATYQPNFVCHGTIMIELKAVTVLADERRAQLLNYLNITGFKLGLLISFGHHPKLQSERIAKTQRAKRKEDVADASL